MSPALDSARRVIAGRPDAAALLVVALAAVAPRLAFFALAPIFTHGDSQQYYEPARALLDGQGFPLALKRAPLYPLVVAAAIRFLGEDLHGLIALQHLMGVGTALLAFGVGRLTFGRGVGLLSGLAAALSGGLLLYEQFVMSEALFAFVLTLTAFLFLLAIRRDSVPLYVASGIAMGLAALTRPHAQLLLLLAPAVAIVCQRRWRPLLRAALIASSTAALIVVPWMARNKVVHGTFTVSGGSGAMLIENMANRNNGEYVFLDPDAPRNEPTRRHYRATVFIQQQADKKESQREDGEESVGLTGRKLLTWMQDTLEVGEVEADGIMRDIAMTTIRLQPATYARLFAGQVARTFSGSPELLAYHWDKQRERDFPKKVPAAIPPITSEQEQTFPLADALVALYQPARFGVLLPLLYLVGLVASALRLEWRPALFPGLAVAAIYLSSAAIVGFVVRYHHPPEPLLHVLAFGGGLFIWQQASQLVPALRPRPARPRSEPLAP